MTVTTQHVFCPAPSPHLCAVTASPCGGRCSEGHALPRRSLACSPCPLGLGPPGSEKKRGHDFPRPLTKGEPQVMSPTPGARPPGREFPMLRSPWSRPRRYAGRARCTADPGSRTPSVGTVRGETQRGALTSTRPSSPHRPLTRGLSPRPLWRATILDVGAGRGGPDRTLG